MRHAPLAAAVLVALLAAVPPPAPAAACATVFDAAHPVRIVGEEALIVWDPARGEEHFIRRAGFRGGEGHFGFLVPTPSRPEVEDAGRWLFSRLFELYRRPPRRARSRARGSERGRVELDDPFVEVLERRTVAGLDTAVLAANDAGALVGWLGENGYPSSPALQRWLAPYVEDAWTVTAFRYAAGAGGSEVGSAAVRLTFATDTPFYPYSEPSSRGPARPLRVSVVSPERMTGRVGGRPWRARVGYAQQPGAALRHAISDAVPARAFNDQSWLTVFDEPRSRRGRDDLTFRPARRQAPVAARLTRAITLGAAPSREEVMDPF